MHSKLFSSKPIYIKNMTVWFITSPVQGPEMSHTSVSTRYYIKMLPRLSYLCALIGTVS